MEIGNDYYVIITYSSPPVVYVNSEHGNVSSLFHTGADLTISFANNNPNGLVSSFRLKGHTYKDNIKYIYVSKV